MCTQKQPRDWSVAKGDTYVKHVGELKGHASYSTTGQNFQFDQTVSLRLVPVMRSSRQNALFVRNLTVHIPHSLYYIYPYTHEM